MGVRSGYQPGKSPAATTMPTSGVGSVRGGYKPRPEAQIPEPSGLERKVINSFNTLDNASRNSTIKRLQASAGRGDVGAQRKLLLLSNYANKNAAATPDYTDNSLSGKLYRAGRAVGQFGKEALVDPVLRGGQALTELANTGKISNGKQFAADVVNTGTNFVGGGVVKKLAQEGVKLGAKALIKRGVKEGAALGAVQGGATSFGRNNSVGEIARDTAIGGALGGVAGGAVPVVSAGARKGVSKLAQGLEEAAARVRPVNNATVANMGRTVAQDVKGAAKTTKPVAKPDAIPPTSKLREGLPQAQERPAHQAAIEAAVAKGDMGEVKRIIDAMPDSDPYKTSMTSLFKDRLPQATEKPGASPKGPGIQRPAEVPSTLKGDKWSTPLPDSGPSSKMTGVKDSQGVEVRQGDVIEFPALLDDQKTGRATVTWQGPYKANATGKEFPGAWIGNGELGKNNIPFKVVERDGKPFAPSSDTPKTIANDVPADVMNPGSKERGFVTSVKESPAISQGTKDLADSSYDSISNKTSLAKADARIAADEGAARQWVINAKKPTAEHTATAIRLIDQYDKAGRHSDAAEVVEAIAKKLTEAGQAIQAASILGRLSPDGIAIYAQRQINNINDKRAASVFGRFSKDVKLTPETTANLRQLAKNIEGLSGPAKVEAQQELQSALQALLPATVGRKIATAQTIAQLLNPKTLIRNTVGNEMFYRIERLNKYVATPIDMARSTLTGKDRTVTFHTAGQGKYWSNFMKGAQAGWKNVSPDGIDTQFDLGNGAAFTGKWNPMTYLEKSLGVVLRGFDYAAYKRAAGNTIGEMATLQAMNKGLKGPARQEFIKNYLENVPKNILDVADEYGKYITFQDSNVLSRGMVSVKRGLNVQKDFGLGDLVLKYPKTPANLIMRGLDYSPAGFLRSAYLLAKPWLARKGTAESTTREATLALSRAITGSLGFTGMGMYLADKGVITGRASKDKDLNALQKQTGDGSYRVNMTALQRWVFSGFNPSALDKKEGDYFASYDWAQPIAMAVSLGANANQAIKKQAGAVDTALSTGNTVLAATNDAVQTVADQPLFSGVKNLFGGSYGNVSDVTTALSRTAVSAPASFVPTLSNQIRQLTDSNQRDAYTGSSLQQSINQVLNKIPGQSDKLSPRVDTLGQTMKTTGATNPAEKVFNVFFNPAITQRYKLTPAAKLVVDLYDRTGQTTQIPRMVSKSVTVDGKKVSLSPEQYSSLQQYVGYNTRTMFEKLNASPEFNGLSDNDKILVMQQVMTAIGQEAQKKMFAKDDKTTEQKLIERQASRARSSVVKSVKD